MAKSTEDAKQAILDAIVKEAGIGTGRGSSVRDLAEAWAWLEWPNNPHGGSVKVSK